MPECTCADPMQVADKIANETSTRTEKNEANTKYLDETLHGSETDDDEGTGKGQHGRLDRIRFCHWAAPEYGPLGETVWTDMIKAAQTGIAILNAAIQGQISDMQQDLAEGYYDMAKFKWDRFAQKYMPLEKAILWEAQSEPIRELNCDDDGLRAQAACAPSEAVSDRIMSELAKKYRMCFDDTTMMQLQYARNKILVDTYNYNLIDDQWFTDFKNDQRWNRRSNILDLGRNLGSIAMRYGDVASKAMGDVGNWANRAFGSVSQALGYYGTRNDSFMPATYLSGMQNNLVSLQPAGGLQGSPTG